ncbi:hypothetical protein ACFQ4C_29845 [Larkinella insperata]|uniref:Plasmid mobilization relaxosome protein MobC n=1 Tax=Larkinella insperata TaxID=332158 RepID=A0ABW3QN60_9BACT
MEEPKKKPGGRPPKEASLKAEVLVKTLFTQSEFQVLMRRKRMTKARSLSAFVRAACLEQPLILRAEPTGREEKSFLLLREVRADLLRVGVNINQAVKRINSTTDYQDLQRETSSLTQKIAEMETKIQSIMALSMTDKIENGSPNQ